MLGETRHLSRRRVVPFAVASVGAAALPSWIGTTQAGGAVASPTAVPIAKGSIASGLSPVFAEVAARLEGLSTHARMLADCAAQEQCEQIFAATENLEQVERWRRHTGQAMKQSRAYVRERSVREAKAAIVGVEKNRRQRHEERQ